MNVLEKFLRFATYAVIDDEDTWTDEEVEDLHAMFLGLAEMIEDSMEEVDGE